MAVIVTPDGKLDAGARRVNRLTKGALADLATKPDRPVPILALNRIDEVLPAEGSSALVKLSLSPEDDAVSMATIAFGTGARRALILAPAGDWGSKMSDTVRAQWTKLGGTVVSSATYSTSCLAWAARITNRRQIQTPATTAAAAGSAVRGNAITMKS